MQSACRIYRLEVLVNLKSQSTRGFYTNLAEIKRLRPQKLSAFIL